MRFLMNSEGPDCEIQGISLVERYYNEMFGWRAVRCCRLLECFSNDVYIGKRQ